MKNTNNIKIKNATKVVNYGINFKSKIEAMMYKTLVEEDINPKYEEQTFILSNKIRPTVPFYNRLGKKFRLDMRPIQRITYTPDFTFEYNGILIIIEAKGVENDVFPVKRNLFRKYLETLDKESMYFEVRTKKELLEVIKIIRMETPIIQKIRKLINNLPEKDISIGHKLLEERNWEELHNLVASDIKKIDKAIERGDNKYDNIDIISLYDLQTTIPDV